MDNATDFGRMKENNIFGSLVFLLDFYSNFLGIPLEMWLFVIFNSCKMLIEEYGYKNLWSL